MKEIEVLQKLNRKAREENPPAVDVTMGVMRKLRVLQEPEDDPITFRFLEWLTVFSSATAVLAGAMIFLSVSEYTDPLIALFFEVQ